MCVLTSGSVNASEAGVTASLKVARDLYGEGSSQVAQIGQSFAAVGLDGTWEAPEVEGC